MGHIFINYRRADAANAAGRLYDRLEDHFGRENLFIDVDQIAGGVDFVEELNTRLAQTDVLLAVIGPEWLNVRDSETGTRRLDNAQDFVRIEIEKALANELEIIPILVDGADMPAADDLPAPMRPLSRRNAMRLTHERFRADVQGVISSIEQAVERRHKRRNKLERQRQKQEQEQEDKERAEQQEKMREAAHLQALQGMSPEQIASAEAMANWDFIKESTEAEDFRDHLARYSDHEASQPWARARLEELSWAQIKDSQDKDAFFAFLEEFPSGKYTNEAEELLHALQEKEREQLFQKDLEESEQKAWNFVKDSSDPAVLEKFLKEYPRGAYAQDAKALIKKLSKNRSLLSRRALFIIGGLAGAVFSIYIYSLINTPGSDLWRLLYDKSQKTLRDKYSTRIYSLTYSPDGRFLAAGWYNSLVLRNASDGKIIKEIEHPRRKPFAWQIFARNYYVSDVKISLDSKEVFTASSDGKIRQWDVKSGKLIKLYKGHKYKVRIIDLSPDGRNIVSAAENQIRIWDVNSGRQLLEYTETAQNYIYDVEFSPDGTKLAIATEKKQVKLLDAKTGAVLKTYTGHLKSVSHIAFTPDGTILASSSHDRTIRLWNVRTGRQIKVIQNYSQQAPNSSVGFYNIAISPNGRWLLSFGESNSIKLWDFRLGSLIKTYTGHLRSPHKLAFSPKEPIFVSASFDKTIKFWHLP